MDNAAPIRTFSEKDRRLILAMLRKGVNTPRTSSAGRLFDAVASLAGVRHETTFEGQAAMELEFALSGVETREAYPFELSKRDGVVIMDWEPMIQSILTDGESAIPPALISARFHNTLVEMLVKAAVEIGERRVVLTGGCFQNRYLTETAVARLEEAGFRPYWHQRIPPNDGGIALGQIAAAEYFDSRGENS
jgi:hydrogenase maturation protein HypF